MRALLFSLPLWGHVTPSLPVVRDLVRQSEDVIYISTEEFRQPIEATGAQFQPYSAWLQQDFVVNSPGHLIELVRMMLRVTEKMVKPWLQKIELLDPDYILFHAVCFWGKYIAQLVGKPTISLSGSLLLGPGQLRSLFPQLWMDSMCSMYIDSLEKQFGLRPNLDDIFTGYADTNIVFTSRYFQPHTHTFDESYHFVGVEPWQYADEKSPFDSAWVEKRPIIYISLGTIFNEDPTFYQMCFRALGKIPCSVILSTGPAIAPETLGAIPDNFIVCPYVHQCRVLASADCFISHGGMNSVNEACYYGVPLVIIPQAREQPLIARQAEYLGTAIRLEKGTFDHHILQKAVLRTLSDSSFARCSQQIGTTLRAAGGATAGVKAILEMTRKFHV